MKGSVKLLSDCLSSSNVSASANTAGAIDALEIVLPCCVIAGVAPLQQGSGSTVPLDSCPEPRQDGELFALMQGFKACLWQHLRLEQQAILSTRSCC